MVSFCSAASSVFVKASKVSPDKSVCGQRVLRDQKRYADAPSAPSTGTVGAGTVEGAVPRRLLE
jgi:hypothetical protein